MEKLGDSISTFIRQVCVAYVMNFNEKYERVGGLFQGRFKSRLVSNDESLLQVSRYIHLNPLGLKENISTSDLHSYKWSSYMYYLGSRSSDFCKSSKILDISNDYKNFVEAKAIEDYKGLTEDYTFNKRRVKSLR